MRPTIDPALFDCPDAPAVPGADATQRTVALWLPQLWQAWRACKDQLGAIEKALAGP